MQENINNTEKHVLLTSGSPDLDKKVKKVKKETKEKSKRVVTTKQKWSFTETELLPEKQMEYIFEIRDNIENPDTKTARKIILQQIQQKIHGYRHQDITKDIYSLPDFIDMDYIIYKMIECENICYYCKKKVHVLYEFVREPNQWTVERIDNDYGHNKGNIVIACLHCNLHRKVMYQERYVFTKQLVINKIE